MGYTTKFIGHIKLSRQLTLQEAKQLLEFNEDSDLIKEGEHPRGYMQWVPSETLDAIVWDQQEKFYDYEAWLTWIVKWLAARGINCAGQLDWRGESSDDIGKIIVVDGRITVEKGVKLSQSNHKPMTLDKLARQALDMATGPASDPSKGAV